MQANILHRGPDNRQATGFRRKDVDLIGALAHITKEAFNGVRGSNVPVHSLRKGIKGQEVLFVFSQASHRFGIALSIFGFEGGRRGMALSTLRCLWSRQR